ncbi:MAG: hypothetical protein WAN47_07220 [Nitrosotalea sp.]
MENRDYTLIVILVIVTAVAVSAADAAGIPKKAISTVGQFLESDLPSTTVFTDTVNTYTAGDKQTFQNSGTTAGLNLASSADPSSLASGDLWLSTTTANTLKYQASSGTQTVGALGLSQTWTGANTFSGGTTITDPTTTSKQLTFSLSGMTAGKTLTLSSAQTTTQALAIPNIAAGDTLGTLGLTQTWTGANTFSHDTNTFTAANTGLVVSNAANTHATTLAGGAVTANETLNLPLITGSDTLGALNMIQTWTGNNTMKFGSGGIIIRNPASTFTTKISNAAVAANETLNLPLTKETETFAVRPQINYTVGHAALGNATGPTAATVVMMGDYATLTPEVTGNVEVTISGYVDTGSNGGGCVIEIRYSTSNMGINGATLAGTELGSDLSVKIPTSGDPIPFARTGEITGLTPGTTEYVDLAAARTTSGSTCVLYNTEWLLQEK